MRATSLGPSELATFNIGIRMVYSRNPIIQVAKSLLSSFHYPFYAAFKATALVNERLAEVPFTFSSIPDAKTVLDVGSAESLIPLQLASCGKEVWTIDPRGYPLSHPRLHSVVGDAAAMPFESDSFDAVLAISTVEHIGIGYSETPSSDKDLEALKEMRRVLKTGGRLVLTVPFGSTVQKDRFQRIYDRERLTMLSRGLEVVKSVYFSCEPRGAVSVVPEAVAMTTPFDYLGPYCVAALCCTKPA